ncbi:MAG TPA: glycosyltransferase [Actinoplanes sp.]|nr:glycosyltransferase [Actinoplanes sp.]
MPISVVVLTYNSARTIDRCLDSLAAQRVRPAEIVVVDDASTDGTVAAVAAFEARSGLSVRLVHNGSHNISRGRNLGLSAAQHRLVAFLDSDAWAASDWLAELERAFAADAGLGVVGGGVRTAHASRFAEAVAVNDDTVRQLATSGELLVGGCNMAVNLAEIGDQRFDERWVHAEDIEFVDRIGSRARWAVAPAAVVWHESRAAPRGYLRQMYRYGMWRVRYATRTGKVRAVDYVPTTVTAAAVVLGALVSPWLLLLVPGMSLAETAFVVAYRRPAIRLWPLMLIGWLVKNAGWGMGVLVALTQHATARSQVPPQPARTAG